MSTLTEKRNLLQEIETSFNGRGFNEIHSRKRALELLTKKGLPTSKSEEYKFTPITRALEKVLTLSDVKRASGNAAIPNLIPGLPCNVIAFVNGIFAREQSVLLDSDIKIQTTITGDASVENDPFDLLNQAFTKELVQITIAPKKTIEHPIAIVYYFDSNDFIFSNPRWQLTVGTQSSASVLEYVHADRGTSYFNNKQSSITIAENAHVEYTVIQNGADTDIQTNNTQVTLASNSTVSCFTFTFEGQIIRNNLTVIVDGQGVDAHLHGLYLLSAKTIADNHTTVDHRQPNSNSNELYKGVMDGSSKGVFNGKIYVRPHAQKTNAFQSNRNILLSENATINTKPQLEIWADDVKCSHGCTTGQLDEEALFYLRSRGISKEEARGMMLNAFAAQTLATMKNKVVMNFVDNIISDKLQKSF
ncbi:Fe-S cluster assembly protein SufD [soil metagenome]